MGDLEVFVLSDWARLMRCYAAFLEGSVGTGVSSGSVGGEDTLGNCNSSPVSRQILSQQTTTVY